MTISTLLAAAASMGVASMTTDISANGQTFTNLSVVAPVAASLAANGFAAKRQERAFVQSRMSARIKPLQPQTDHALSLGDAFKMQRGGVVFALTAFKPKSLKDVTTVRGVRRMQSHRRQMRAMGKAMPGYPQPPKAVVAMKVRF